MELKSVTDEKPATGFKQETVKNEAVCLSKDKKDSCEDNKHFDGGVNSPPSLTNGDTSTAYNMVKEEEALKREPKVAKCEPFTNGHPPTTAPAIFSPLNHIPSSSLKPSQSLMNGASHNHLGSNSHSFHNTSGNFKNSQNDPKVNSRSISPAYSDISDEETDHSSPQNLASKSTNNEQKQGLMNVRKEKPIHQPTLPTPDPSRVPLDLTQPSFATPFPPPLRPGMGQFGLGSHLPPVGAPRFPPQVPPGLPTSTPSLNMLHSIMASAAKLQEFQQALGTGLLPLPTSSSSSLSKSNPFPKHSGLPPPPPLRHEHNHLHLGPGFPPAGLSINSPSSMASKMAMAAEVAKRALPPVTSGSPLHLAPHLSPFVSGLFYLY